MHRALTSESGRKGEFLGAEAFHRGFAHAALEICLDAIDQVRVDEIELCTSLLEGCSVLEPPEQIGPVGSAIAELLFVEPAQQHGAHRHRHEDVRRRAQRRAAEAGGRHTDYGQRLAVDDDVAVQHLGVGTQLVLPVLVREHGDEVFAEVLVIRGLQHPARRRLYAEHFEVVAGDEDARAAYRAAVERQVGTEGDVGRDS